MTLPTGLDQSIEFLVTFNRLFGSGFCGNQSPFPIIVSVPIRIAREKRTLSDCGHDLISLETHASTQDSPCLWCHGWSPLNLKKNQDTQVHGAGLVLFDRIVLIPILYKPQNNRADSADIAITVISMDPNRLFIQSSTLLVMMDVNNTLTY